MPIPGEVLAVIRMDAKMTRRTLLQSTALAAAGRSALFGGRTRLQIGVTDWNLRQTGKLEAVAMAKRLGFDGVQVSLGRDAVGGKLPLADPELQSKYVDAAKSQGIALDGTCLDILHVNYLKNDPLGKKWVADSIPITKKLDATVILLPFFGKGALTTPRDLDYVGDIMREMGPEAEKAGVILGLENTNSAEENMRILDRARSKAVLVYYDIGNSAGNGYDVPREIRQFGRKRICQFHFKDNPHYLGEGKVSLSDALQSIAEIEFRGFANLETDSPSKNIDMDMRRNLAYVRRVMKENRM